MANPYVTQAPSSMGMIAPDIQAEQMALARQQQMADMLRQQGSAPIDQQMVGNRVVKISPWQGLAKMLTAGVGGYMQHQNDEKSLELGKRYNSRVAELLAGPQEAPKIGQLGSGTYGIEEPPQGQPAIPSQPKQNNRFDMPALFRGQLIHSIGGDSAASAYWDDGKRTPEMKNMEFMGQDPLLMGRLGTAKARKDGIIELQPGTTALDLSNGQERFQPKVGDGISLNNGVASALPGYADASAGIAGAQARATETAKAGLDLVTLNTPNGTVMVTREQAAQMAGGTPSKKPIAFTASNGVSLNFSDKSPQEIIDSAMKSTDPNFKQAVTEWVNSGAPKTPGIQLQSDEGKAFGASVAKGAGEDLLKGRDRARGAADDLFGINESRKAIATGAFLGSGADFKTDFAKAAKGWIGVDIDPTKVTNSEYLRSTLGQRMLDNAKKLGVSPTDADARRLDTIIGTIAKDPKALSKAMDFQEEMAIRAIKQHNVNVSDAEKRGLQSPYDMSVALPSFGAATIPVIPDMSAIQAEIARRRGNK